DSELCEILVRNSLATATWVARQGVKLQPGLGRQAYKVDGKFKFWGGLALHIWGGGPELLNALYANVERRGIPIVYETPAISLIRERGRITGVVAEHRGESVAVKAGAVVLACGGFESNPEMRARYVDEGANFHSHTYAKYGGRIMSLPGMFAWQIFDAKANPLLRGEYRIRRVTKAEASTLEELAPKLTGVDAAAFLRTVREFNAA